MSDYTATAAGWTITGLQNGATITAGKVTSASKDVDTYAYTGTTAPTASDEMTITTAFTTSDDITNYNVSYDFKQVITPRTLTITVNDIKVFDGTPLETEYDGTALTVSGLQNGATLTAGVVATSSDTVATYTYVGTTAPMATDRETVTTAFETSDGIANYSVSYNLMQKITYREISITARNANKVFDNTPLTQPGFIVYPPLPGTDTHDFNVVMTAASTITAVGTKDNEIATIDGVAMTTGVQAVVGNYRITTAKGLLEVTAAALSITLDTTKLYDGTEFVTDYMATTDGWTIVGLATGDYITSGVVTSTGYKTVGEYTGNGTVGASQITTAFTTNNDISNYEVAYNFTQKIVKNNLPIVITSGDMMFDYDGHTHNFPSYTVTYNGNSVSRLAADSTKFELPTGDTLSIINPASITYYFENTPNNNTFSYELDNDDNYDETVLSMVNGTISINVMSHPLEITSLGQTWTYDGNAHSYKHYTVKFADEYITGTGIVNDTVFVLPTTDTLIITNAPSITDAGKLANTFTYTLQHDNLYVGSRDTIIDTLRVNPLTGVEVTVKEHGLEMTYDGFEQWVTGYDLIAINNSLYDASFFHYSGIEEDSIAKGRYVGNYPMNIQPTDYTNDNPNFEAVTFIIQNDSLVIKPNPNVITITASSAERPFDGTPLVDSSYSYTPGILAAGDTLIVEVRGSIITFGDSLNRVVDYKVFRNEDINPLMVRKNVSAPVGNYRDVTDCYTFATTEAGHLRITPNGNVSVTITGHTGEYNYDGTVHHVGNYDIVITDTLNIYQTSDFHFTGDSTLDETAAGTYYMNMVETQFVNDNANYAPVTFNVTDGWMVIYDSLIVSNITVDSVTCKDYNDGEATITVEGGKRVTSPYYSYDVTGVNTGDNYANTTDGIINLTGLKPDTYNVTITDALAYTATATFIIEEPALLTADVTVQADLCPNQPSYAVEMTTTGGNGGNHFAWYNAISDGAVVEDVDAMSTVVNKISGLDCDHTYQVAVKVTDRKNCEARDTVIFTVVDTENPTFTRPDDITICRNADGDIEAPASITGEPDAASFSDNCTAPSQLVVTFVDADTTGADNERRVIHRVWRVTDLCGRYSEQTQNITVRPAISAAGNMDFICPANIDTVIRHGGCNLKLTYIGAPVVNNHTTLNDAEFVITNNAPVDSIYEVGETTVTWTITDSCGFSLTCDQVIKVSFQPCPDAVDFEDSVYHSVRLGSGCKCWTTTNLKSTKYSDGRQIDNVMNYSSFDFPNADENVNIFGHLYDWYAAADTARYGSVDSVERAYNMGHRIQGICPDGWYLPSDEDYEELNVYPTTDLRSTSYWINVNGQVNTNATGFNSLPGGKYNCESGRYEDIMGNSYYWTCHPVYDMATGAMIDYICEKIMSGNTARCNGYSIRCVYDEH